MNRHSMQRARVDGDGTELAFAVEGAANGEPVVLIHGALFPDEYACLTAEPGLATHYRLVRYHRRGYGGSSRRRATAPVSVAQHAADCRALLRHLDIERAHVAGHSSGGAIALQLALDAPDAVHSLVLLEPALLDVPSGALFAAALAPAIRLYEAGMKEETVDAFCQAAIGRDYRLMVDRVIPGGVAKAVGDADTLVGVEMPALGAWRFIREDARRISQPVLSVLGAESATLWPGWPEVHARVQEWLPQTEGFVLPGANHALNYMNPRGTAEALAAFFARHPIPMPASATAPVPTLAGSR